MSRLNFLRWFSSALAAALGGVFLRRSDAPPVWIATFFVPDHAPTKQRIWHRIWQAEARFNRTAVRLRMTRQMGWELVKTGSPTLFRAGPSDEALTAELGIPVTTYFHSNRKLLQMEIHCDDTPPTILLYDDRTMAVA